MTDDKCQNSGTYNKIDFVFVVRCVFRDWLWGSNQLLLSTKLLAGGASGFLLLTGSEGWHVGLFYF